MSQSLDRPLESPRHQRSNTSGGASNRNSGGGLNYSGERRGGGRGSGREFRARLGGRGRGGRSRGGVPFSFTSNSANNAVIASGINESGDGGRDIPGRGQRRAAGTQTNLGNGRGGGRTFAPRSGARGQHGRGRFGYYSDHSYTIDQYTGDEGSETSRFAQQSSAPSTEIQSAMIPQTLVDTNRMADSEENSRRSDVETNQRSFSTTQNSRIKGSFSDNQQVHRDHNKTENTFNANPSYRDIQRPFAGSARDLPFSSNQTSDEIQSARTDNKADHVEIVSEITSRDSTLSVVDNNSTSLGPSLTEGPGRGRGRGRNYPFEPRGRGRDFEGRVRGRGRGRGPYIDRDNLGGRSISGRGRGLGRGSLGGTNTWEENGNRSSYQGDKLTSEQGGPDDWTRNERLGSYASIAGSDDAEPGEWRESDLTWNEDKGPRGRQYSHVKPWSQVNSNSHPDVSGENQNRDNQRSYSNLYQSHPSKGDPQKQHREWQLEPSPVQRYTAMADNNIVATSLPPHPSASYVPYEKSEQTHMLQPVRNSSSGTRDPPAFPSNKRHEWVRTRDAATLSVETVSNPVLEDSGSSRGFAVRALPPQRRDALINARSQPGNYGKALLELSGDNEHHDAGEYEVKRGNEWEHPGGSAARWTPAGRYPSSGAVGDKERQDFGFQSNIVQQQNESEMGVPNPPDGDRGVEPIRSSWKPDDARSLGKIGNRWHPRQSGQGAFTKPVSAIENTQYDGGPSANDSGSGRHQEDTPLAGRWNPQQNQQNLKEFRSNHSQDALSSKPTRVSRWNQRENLVGRWNPQGGTSGSAADVNKDLQGDGNFHGFVENRWERRDLSSDDRTPQDASESIEQFREQEVKDRGTTQGSDCLGWNEEGRWSSGDGKERLEQAQLNKQHSTGGSQGKVGGRWNQRDVDVNESVSLDGNPSSGLLHRKDHQVTYTNPKNVSVGRWGQKDGIGNDQYSRSNIQHYTSDNSDIGWQQREDTEARWSDQDVSQTAGTLWNSHPHDATCQGTVSGWHSRDGMCPGQSLEERGGWSNNRLSECRETNILNSSRGTTPGSVGLHYGPASEVVFCASTTGGGRGRGEDKRGGNTWGRGRGRGRDGQLVDDVGRSYEDPGLGRSMNFLNSNLAEDSYPLNRKRDLETVGFRESNRQQLRESMRNDSFELHLQEEKRLREAQEDHPSSDRNYQQLLPPPPPPSQLPQPTAPVPNVFDETNARTPSGEASPHLPRQEGIESIPATTMSFREASGNFSTNLSNRGGFAGRFSGRGFARDGLRGRSQRFQQNDRGGRGGRGYGESRSNFGRGTAQECRGFQGRGLPFSSVANPPPVPTPDWRLSEGSYAALANEDSPPIKVEESSLSETSNSLLQVTSIAPPQSPSPPPAQIKSPSPPRSPPPEPGPPTGFVVSLARMVDAESQLDYVYAKHLLLIHKRKVLRAQINKLLPLPIGSDAFKDDLAALIADLEKSKEESEKKRREEAEEEDDLYAELDADTSLP